MGTMIPECKTANAASERANASGLAVDHAAAMRANSLASAAAFKASDPEVGKLHAKKAAEHKSKGKGGPAASPLATWAKSKKK